MQRHLFSFPEDQAERELMIDRMFAAAVNHRELAFHPIAPITTADQNDQDDLYFTIETAQGRKLLELAEFAPLQAYGGSYDKAPRHFTP